MVQCLTKPALTLVMSDNRYYVKFELELTPRLSNRPARLGRNPNLVITLLRLHGLLQVFHEVGGDLFFASVPQYVLPEGSTIWTVALVGF